MQGGISMKNARRFAFVFLIALVAVMLTGCGDHISGRWTEYKTETYVLEDGKWTSDGEWLISDTGRDPIIAEFTPDGKMILDGDECEYEIEDSYLRLYQNGYLETDLIRFDGNRMVVQARYDDELKVIYFRKN